MSNYFIIKSEKFEITIPFNNVIAVKYNINELQIVISGNTYFTKTNHKEQYENYMKWLNLQKQYNEELEKKK